MDLVGQINFRIYQLGVPFKWRLCYHTQRKVVASLLHRDKSIHLSKKEHHKGKETKESDIQQGPVEVSKLSCVVQIQSFKSTIIRQLEGQEDDWVQAQLED